jgi:hypothetical protein
MELKPKQLTVADAYTVMGKVSERLDSENLSERSRELESKMSILMETIIIGLLYLEYPSVVMEKIAPVIKAAIARIAASYKETGKEHKPSDFYAYFLRNSYRNNIMTSLDIGSLSDEDKKKFSDEAVSKLMELGRELADKPSKNCASVCYGLFASSYSGLNGAVAYDGDGNKASEETMMKGIANQSAAGILAYKAFLLDVAASEGVEFEGKRVKGICIDNKFCLTNDSSCAPHVSETLSIYTMDALIESSDKYAALSAGIAESESFKSSKEYEKEIQSRVDEYKKQYGDDIKTLQEKMSEDPEISKVATLVEKRFEAYTTDPKTNTSKANSIFTSAALDVLNHTRSVVVTNK